MTHMLIGSLRFAGDLPVWLVASLALVAVFAVLVLYQRETKQLRSPYQYLLPALRATAVAMAIFILAGPVWHHRQVVGTLGRVVFAVDTSQSMSLGDSRSVDPVENRLQRVTEKLLGTDTEPGWLEQLATTHAIDVIAFDQKDPVAVWSSTDSEELPEAFEWAAEGAATNLTRPLEAIQGTLNLASGSDTPVSQEVDSVRRAAVVLMTDGRDTDTLKQLGRSAPSIAKQLADGGTVVNTVGFGSVDEPPDLGIVEVIHPETVAAEGKLAGEIIVKRFASSGEPALLRIESDGKTVWQQTLQLGDTPGQSIPYEVDVQSLVESIQANAPRGITRNNEVLRLVAKIESSQVEQSLDNNRYDFRIAASTRNRKLLIVDSSSRWETRYLKNLFVRDPSWESHVVLFGPSTESQQLPRGDAPGEFPASEQGISQYDAILIGDIDADQLSMQDRSRIARFVMAGGGLILIDGRFGGMRSLSRTEFNELMPVRFSTSGRHARPMHLRVTASGIEQPALSLIDQTSDLAAFWKSIPSPTWCADVELAEGAESWAECVLDSESDSPWLATRMYGAGRVFYLGSDQTWRWRYKVADRFHARFWNQLVVAAMQPPFSASDQFVSIGTDKVEYSGNESVAIRARLRDVRGNPVADATVDALVLHQDDLIATVPMNVNNPDQGTYTGVASGLAPGEYQIRIRASGFDESALPASTPIWISDGGNDEMRRMSLDEDSMRQIASAGRGTYVHESSAEEMLELLKPLSSGTIIESDTVLWQSYYWFWSIIALLAIEWWCRKRAGLV